jgi:hypothetical protein
MTSSGFLYIQAESPMKYAVIKYNYYVHAKNNAEI